MSPPTTFHLVPRAEWAAADPSQPYVPSAFASDGFVHCTDGADEVALTATRYYSGVADLLVLILDRSRLSAEVRYEDPGQIYPHVYGPIERAAIREVLVMARDPNGTFLPPEA